MHASMQAYPQTSRAKHACIHASAPADFTGKAYMHTTPSENGSGFTYFSRGHTNHVRLAYACMHACVHACALILCNLEHNNAKPHAARNREAPKLGLTCVHREKKISNREVLEKQWIFGHSRFFYQNMILKIREKLSGKFIHKKKNADRLSLIK